MTLRPGLAHGLVAAGALLPLSSLAQAHQPSVRVRGAQAPGGGAAQPTLLGTYGDWGAYTGSSSGRKVCFALSKPTKAETTPPNRPRDASYMFISTRPAENVRNEVSIIIGYGFKPSSEASVEIGSAK